ncbi:hypothetical protein GCWU000342_00771 [Shuttleworthella satelles DSM 14600]|uniref:Uncharacterized protein n=1 Tax=Shuttleworthella satelles DSM 14600 TaxID=626523 RepID=C4G9W6_9FIRM|nr:hypothetical protein GCWU000342_00771 [Shuttleworthia satelles DSM 14600]
MIRSCICRSKSRSSLSKSLPRFDFCLFRQVNQRNCIPALSPSNSTQLNSSLFLRANQRN